VGSLNRRIRKLEREKREPGEVWVIPPEVQVVTKAAERYQAWVEGRKMPPYTQEEIEEMRRADIEIVEGSGVAQHYRDVLGWQSEEAQRMLDSWEEEARRRVELGKDLPPERWREVWGADEDENDEDERGWSSCDPTC
jgi:hypothetical protein